MVLSARTKFPKGDSPLSQIMSAARASKPTTDSGLTPKQQRILDYLSAHTEEQAYYKSRLIGEDLDLSAKEVGANMTALIDQGVDIGIEKWGYSSGTTWLVKT